MSGVEVALGVVAATASFSQLVAYASQIGQAIAKFRRDVENVPAEMQRIQRLVLLLHHGLDYLSTQVTLLDDDELLPPKLRDLLDSTLRNVDEALVRLRKKCSKTNVGGSSKLRSRLKFAWTGHDDLKLLLGRLREAESGLFFTMELLNVHVSSLTFSRIRTIQTNICNLPGSGSQSRATSSSLSHNRTRSPEFRVKTLPKTYAVSSGSWPCWLGFYGRCSWFSNARRHRVVQLWGGYKLPPWIASNCVSLYLQLSLSTSHVSILPCHIRLQNRIPIDSPFLTACRNGDVRRIEQFVETDPWLVNTRSSCNGITPLLLAIDSQNLDAIRAILDAGADANIGDDERTLPIFKAVGYKDNRLAQMPGCPYVQLPPPTTKWLQIFHLLTQYHASVHELAGEKTMTMMKIIGENYEPETTIRFFRILEEEKYADFDLQDKNGWSAVLIALGSHDVATRAIDMLASMGVPIGRIYEDGKTALHHAASYSSKVDTLKHLYETYGLTEVNRQDQYGWTPLHYAIGSAYYKKDGHRCEKVRYLLKMGADPYIKSPEIFFGVHHSSNRPSLKDPVSPIEWAAANGPQVASQFHQDMIAAGLHSLNEENIEEVFHDALEQVTL